MGLLDRITSGVVFVGTAIPEWVASILPKATKKASSDFSPNMFPVPTPTPKPPPPGKKTGSALESADKSCNVCAVQPSAYARNPLATPPWQAKPHSAPFMSCQALAKPPPEKGAAAPGCLDSNGKKLWTTGSTTDQRNGQRALDIEDDDCPWNEAKNRSADNYLKVIDYLNVADSDNLRYTKEGGTYCNIFVHDVTHAMNCKIPHYVSFPGCGDRETNATQVVMWLENQEMGGNAGWTEITAEEAQCRANAGYPTVVVAKAKSADKCGDGSHGHVAMVIPENDKAKATYSDGKYSPVTAQAGGKNFERGNVYPTFGSKDLAAVRYFTHN